MAVTAMEPEIDPMVRYRTALLEIEDVLGTERCTESNCPGCHYEIEEAAIIAHQALQTREERLS